MSNDQRDYVLPWQYTLLIFIWIGGLLAGLLLAAINARGYFPADVGAAMRPYLLGYLFTAVALTPFLVRGGWSRVRRVDADMVGDTQRADGEFKALSAEKLLTISLILFGIGLLSLAACAAGIFQWSSVCVTTVVVFLIGARFLIRYYRYDS